MYDPGTGVLGLADHISQMTKSKISTSDKKSYPAKLFVGKKKVVGGDRNDDEGLTM